MYKPLPEMDDDKFRLFLIENEYQAARKLPDGTWAGLIRLAFTTGLCIGLTDTGWTRRFCYENLTDALGALQDLQAWDDEPEPLYVARRGIA
jgi:hypothetical protein